MGQCQSKSDIAVQDTNVVPVLPRGTSASNRNRNRDRNRDRNRNKGGRRENNPTDSLNSLPSKNIRPNENSGERGAVGKTDSLDSGYDQDYDERRPSQQQRQRKSAQAQTRNAPKGRRTPNSPTKTSTNPLSQSSPSRSRPRNQQSSRHIRSSRSPMLPSIRKSKSKKNVNNPPPQNFHPPRRLPPKNIHPSVPPEWKMLCQRYLPKLITPIDVTTAIEERVSAITDLLEPAQIFRIQRRIRNIARELKTPASGSSTSSTDKADLSSMSSIVSVSGTIKEKSKLLLSKDKLIDETIFRSIFAGGDGILRRGWEFDRPWLKGNYSLQNEIGEKDIEEMEKDKRMRLLIRHRNGANSSPERRTSWLRVNSNEDSLNEPWDLVDPLGSTFIILLALAESRWGHAASAAAAEITNGGLEVDETGVFLDRLPKIEPPVVQGGIDGVPGVTFSNICFLMAMALYGTRSQKLLLLFHILLPPKQLKTLLSKYTFPTWLLEESSDIILSLSSIFFHYSTYKSFNLLNIQVCDTLALLICAVGLNEDSNDQNSFHNHTSARQNQNSFHSPTQNDTYDFTKKHNIESILASIREGTFVESFPYTEKFWESISSVFDSSPRFWSFTDFSNWADTALDDSVLNIIFHRLFASGILPSPSIEKNLVTERWLRWQRYEKNYWVPEGVISRSMSEDRNVDQAQNPKEPKKSLFSKLFNGIGSEPSVSGELESADFKKNKTSVWGGLGGVDGRGGSGHGVMYIIEKGWWETWTKFVGWEEKKQEIIGLSRPKSIPNEIILDQNSPSPLGSLGSYFALQPDLVKNVDYVLVPPGVWDIIYEMYGGGPPLPRMVTAPPANGEIIDSDEKFILDVVDDEENVEIKMDKSVNGIYLGGDEEQQIIPIPKQLEVAAYPWILHCHVCDPYQAYRRGDNGPMSIRVMSIPTQPLWRVFAEILVRLPIHQSRAIGPNGKGVARLWKRIDPSNASTTHITASRYGPWSLLCRNRHAPFSFKRQNGSTIHAHFIDEWIDYTDNATADSIGLHDGSHLMLEFALFSKGDSFIWPREAAAKAGRERRLANEDASFRQRLRGLDANGKLLDPPPALVGTTIDAMDSTGRWYQAEITKIEVWKSAINKANEKRDDDTEEEDDDTTDASGNENMIPGEIIRVRIDFKDSSGYDEWINVTSDRLAVKGRCTLTSVKHLDGNANGVGVGSSSNSSDLKGKSTTSSSNSNSSVRKSNGVSNSNTIESPDVNGNSSTTLCPFPGYGACGLTNLGNTCYANAALQCMGYLPLLRAYLLSNSYKMDLNKDNPLGTGGRVLEEYAELLRILWSGKYNAKAPSRFKQQLGRANGQFAGNDQQDAQELLLAILDSLHEDSNKVRKKPMVPPMEDAWVNNTPVPRVGREAWWRYLRRNKSVIANTAMGQVMNRVTCPVCNHSSLNFDPFGILSIPFPTINEVIFHCTLVRRGSNVNCPVTLSKRKSSNESKDKNDIQSLSPSPPSNRLVFEQYALSMSRLADIGDLKLRLQNLTGIAINRLKLYTTNEVYQDKKDSDNSDDQHSPLDSFVQIIPLPDKPGPCFQLAAQLKPSSSPPDSPTVILAFETTLNPRPLSHGELDDTSTTSGEESEDNSKGRASASHNSNNERQRQLENQLKTYGDNRECVEYDSDPTALSKAMSRNLWPKNASEFTIGLRVDAIDHRKHWFPGSVVEIIDVTDKAEQKQNGDSSKPATKVKIHFDNFTSKWDEHYTISHFQRGQVRPLYSHAVPKLKPIEFMVYHRYSNMQTKVDPNDGNEQFKNNLFGHPFVIECHNEWSTARTGAHILAQASRFLQNKPAASKTMENLQIKIDGENLNGVKKIDVYDRIAAESSIVINEIIQVLVESDRRYVMSSLSSTRTNEKESRFREADKKHRLRRISGNPGSSLRKKLALLLPRLPFEIRICESQAPLGSGQKGSEISEEVFFPFSLVRTIGNFMTAQSSIILDWKDVSDLYARMMGFKRSQAGSYPTFSYPEYPILYTLPKIETHKQSRLLLNESSGKRKATSDKNESSPKRRVTPVHGGMKLGACLDEFCKELHAEGWTCPECKKTREGRQRMTLWHLPDLLTFHIKRFNCSARWREKISTRVNFPLTGLNMRKWCDTESPESQGVDESTVYDLIGVINHYGGMTGGHYVAACKATQCSIDGTEEVSHTFSGAGISPYEMEGETVQTGWRLGRSKEKDQTAVQSKFATAAARTVAESSEPLWLQFDDDLVEPIPPRNVVSETAYVLFYRRRRLSPANIAKYSALD